MRVSEETLNRGWVGMGWWQVGYWVRITTPPTDNIFLLSHARER